ncbi:multicomponent Na+:H+ antiporter subunit C [Orenia metallireducens]|uniref:Multicomponent Na+:H+ antiporter subunit C n=1 Tax=Orenia metallireducens TaxID=1413210 RepID=A0A285HQ01_9FIRM|nr:NADH-quinone oxidoreductase subunit K [Orenia metallireducens]PRX27955.1 multicomponent Na+:H+ antiporter subunit C [Orenia metallireducens]SNY37673.1 multicomponent Na+:H+ antiporter subunit C [Orenia metallireducens]
MQFIYLVVIILFCLGLYTILMNTNLIKIIIGINIMDSSLVLLLVALSYKPAGTAPIIDKPYSVIVDPIPQALALTAIVIGASITALMLLLTIKLHRNYNTLDISEIRRLRG